MQASLKTPNRTIEHVGIPSSPFDKHDNIWQLEEIPSLLGYCAFLPAKHLPKFRVSMLPRFSGSRTFGLLATEDKPNTLFPNIGIHLLVERACYLRRLEFSEMPLLESQIPTANQTYIYEDITP
jgi:hypothetical protein